MCACIKNEEKVIAGGTLVPIFSEQDRSWRNTNSAKQSFSFKHSTTWQAIKIPCKSNGIGVINLFISKILQCKIVQTNSWGLKDKKLSFLKIL